MRLSATTTSPPAAFDPASVNYREGFPTSLGREPRERSATLVNYFKPTQQYLRRVHGARRPHFGTSDHLFGHYFYDWYHQPAIYNPTNLASYTSYFNTRYQNALLSETHTFTTNI